MAAWEDMAVVGRIARPHGLRGDVVVNPFTDFVEERFQVGATVLTRSEQGEETLTVATTRVQGGRPVIGFAGFACIEDAERIVGWELRVPEEALQPLGAHQYYQHHLVGCLVETTTGGHVGEVARVEGDRAGSLLAVAGPRGEILIPFTQVICVEIDVPAKRIRIDPPEGLLELNDSRQRETRRGKPDAGSRQDGRQRTARGPRRNAAS